VWPAVTTADEHVFVVREGTAGAQCGRRRRVRLQLIAAAIASTATLSTATADPTDPDAVTSSFHVYADDDHVTVISPSTRVIAGLGPRTSLAVDATIDAVTGASVDVVSSASPATVHERRVEIGTSVTRILPVRRGDLDRGGRTALPRE